MGINDFLKDGKLDMNSMLDSLRTQVKEEIEVDDSNLDVFGEDFSDILGNFEKTGEFGDVGKENRLFAKLNANDYSFKEVFAFYKYSTDSNIYMAHLRGADRTELIDKVFDNLDIGLETYGYSEEEIDEFFNRAAVVDLSKPIDVNLKDFEDIITIEDSKQLIADTIRDLSRIDDIANWEKDINTLFEKSVLKEDITCYRGTSIKSLLRMANVSTLDELETNGGEVRFNTLASTSINKNKAFDKEVLLEINLKKGDHAFYGKNVAEFSSIEDELLLPRGEYFVNGLSRENINGKEVLVAHINDNKNVKAIEP